MERIDNYYDVVVLGSGFASLCQSRRLKLTMPDLKVLMIDSLSADRTSNEFRQSDALLEIASNFLSKDLGLAEYMIDNHSPKYGISYHWPKDPLSVNTLDDYYNTWVNRQPTIPCFNVQLNRFEEDIIKKNKDIGVSYLKAKIVSLDIPSPGGGDHIRIITDEGEKSISARFLIDGSENESFIDRTVGNLHAISGMNGSGNVASVVLHSLGVERTVF